MSVLDAVEAFRKGALFRKQVSINRDGEDFVVAYQPDNLIVFRHAEASARCPNRERPDCLALTG